MVSKNELSYFSSLLVKKYRQKEKKFLLEGEKLLTEALHSGLHCDVIIASDAFVRSHPETIRVIRAKNVRFEVSNERVIKKLSDTKSPAGIVGVFHMPSSAPETALYNAKVPVVAFENINDPGNLGTMLRTCDWFGYKNVILSEASVELWNPKVIRSSMGSLFHLNIYQEKPFHDYLCMLKQEGFSVAVADTNGTSVRSFSPQRMHIIVFCNEANGPTDQLLTLSDQKLFIPGDGQAESLNVAIASSIILYSIKAS